MIKEEFDKITSFFKSECCMFDIADRKCHNENLVWQRDTLGVDICKTCPSKLTTYVKSDADGLKLVVNIGDKIFKEEYLGPTPEKQYKEILEEIILEIKN